MSIDFGNNIIIYEQWTDLKTSAVNNTLSIQYQQSSDRYTIFVVDAGVVQTCTIYTGNIPNFINPDAGDPIDQTTNDSYKSDFETNYKSYANKPIDKFSKSDPRIIYRLGNLTATSTNEVLISARTYNEPASQAQRSVKSSNNNDRPAGTGSKAVRLTYLDSNYVLKTEDITLNGTTAVNTVATDIRFIEKFQVIQGASAAGAIELFPNTGGTGTAICGIASGTEDAFLCHHYVPAGKRGYILEWGSTHDDDCAFKLKGQTYYNGNLVDENWDLCKVAGSALTPDFLEFHKPLINRTFDEKTYIRVTVAPFQSTSTIIRGYFYYWEDVR